ncbi:DUF1904 family protein [[Acholeplasma] multilocale]|uniref:DUF1904 family protein n=1 Tax=[Acholeplasma] multilocale TaxID=264638 RepID=UPI00047E0D6A|nr:DUF1904 family protein [[Acholeplasma] multilocale]
MPILKFSGISEKRVEEYSKKINEIAQLVVADPANIMFIAEGSKIFPEQGKQTPIYVTVEWMARPDKEQLLTNHLVEFFKEDSEKVSVFFTEINGKFYVKGNKVG